MTIETYRAQFVADNLLWRERLGYGPRDFTVRPIKRGRTLAIVAFAQDEWLHEIVMPARGMHPDMRVAIAESFRAAIAGEDAELRRSA